MNVTKGNNGGNGGESCKNADSSRNEVTEEAIPRDERSTRRRNRLRNTVESLHREMEIAEYMVNHQGRSRRRLATHLRKSRTRKRKALEADDEQRHAMAVVETAEKKKRLRGSKVAFEDEVVNGSMIFGRKNDRDVGNKANEETDDDELIEQQEDDEDENDDDYDYDDDDDDYIEEDSMIEDENDLEGELEDEEEGNNANAEKGRYEMYTDELSDQELFYLNYNFDATKTALSAKNQDGDDFHDKQQSEDGTAHTGMKKPPRNSRRGKPPSSTSSQPNPSQAAKLSAVALGKQKISARLMYRLKNFKSHRLAQKHGIALGQFARGCHKTAVHKLSQVADAAPIAPQVYSSLGLVYENLLLKQLKLETNLHPGNDKQNHLTVENQDNNSISNNKTTNQESNNEKITPDESIAKDDQHKEKQQTQIDTPQHIQSRMNLARKAYGSYHVAALLCKKDFTLWLRAADCAMEMADLHALAMTSTTLILNEEQLGRHREERKKWLEEAKDDYTAADNLHPPGITIPAKLANVQMELGNLSEALTILTDLKNNQTAILASMYNKTHNRGRNKSMKSQRTELERSYTAWLLYGDLMLRIGHECNNWNRSVSEIDNYMFRRWLRKYSSTFDWRERRLQALCLALEAAAGSKSCSRLIEWTRDRAMRVRSADGQSKNVVIKGDYRMMNRGAMDNQRWQVDSYEADQKAAQEKAEAERKARNEKERQAKAKANDQKENKNIQNNCNDHVDENDKDDNNQTLEDRDNEDENNEEEKNNEEQEEKNKKPRSYTDEEENTPLFYSSTLNQGDFQDDLDSKFQTERKLMISRHRAQLAKYDSDTSEMKLVENSHAALTRAANRLKLVQKQKLAVVKLVGNFHAKKLAQKKNSSLILEENESMDEDEESLGGNSSSVKDGSIIREKSNVEPKPLPISAPCSSVCFIASQLMRQCLSLELYHGAKLVAEAVSSYFMERASKYDQKCEKIRNAQDRLKNNLLDTVQLSKEEYDDINNDSSEESDGEEYIDDLSDNEDLENDKTGQFLNELRRGILPMELQFLYSLSLIGEGNSQYLASSFFQSIKLLDDGDESIDVSSRLQRLDQEANDTGIYADKSWIIFRNSMTKPITRTAAFAFASDSLQNMKKEKEWAIKLSDFFNDQLEYLEKRGDFEFVFKVKESSEKDKSLLQSTIKSQLIKILLATCRMNLVKTQKMMNVVNKIVANDDKSDDTISEVKEKVKEIQDCAHSIVTVILRYHEVLWSNANSENGAIKSISIEFLKVVSGAFSVLMKCAISLPETHKFLHSKSRKEEILSLLTKLRTALSTICQTSIPNHEYISAATSSMLPESWKQFPIPCEWQHDVHRLISTCAFNLCVGCTVSAFSGWEKDEFELELLRKRRGPNYFGVKVQGMQVAGYLNASNELELANQWALIQKIVPSLESLSFEDKLAQAKKAEWLVETMKKLKNQHENEKVAVFGEEHGVNLFLIYSKLCLLVALEENDTLKEESLLKQSLSIVLPMSQFCVDKTIWTSEIGTKATKHGGVSEWENFVELRSKFEGISDRTLPPPPCRLRPPTRKVTKSQVKAAERPRLPSDSPLAKLIKVPASLLLQEWIGKDHDEIKSKDSSLNKWTPQCSGPAHFAMKNLDYAIKRLRQCFTVHSLQKASVQVAAALLEVASQKECHNPFLCLHQAAVFASQGSKGGNNDECFKKEIPREDECSPNEALGILGRADCMRAIHFTDEAMFLCSYVVKICCLHRDRERPDLVWNSKWRVVGIQTYIISVAIDSTICSLMEVEVMIAVLDT